MPNNKLASKVVGKQQSILKFFSTPPPEGKTVSKRLIETGGKNNGNTTNDKESQQIYMTPTKKFKANAENEEINNDVTTNKIPLTPEQRKTIESRAVAARLLKASNLLKVLDLQMGKTWFAALEGEFRKDYFQKLNDFVIAARSRATVFPPPENVWEWTKQYPIQDVKVVILGQDPYHGPKQAHGLCFSVQKGVASPPSLGNMYKELETDIAGFVRPTHGYLQGWADQGVLLLNAVLTVESGKANAHKDKGWENITDAVISWISKNLNSVVFLLWGSYAQKKTAIVDKNKHFILQGPHPSPLSAHKGFFGCKHFSKCNEILEKQGKQPIDWKQLP